MIYAPRGECLRFVGVVVVAVTRNRGRAPLFDSILTHGAPPRRERLAHRPAHHRGRHLVHPLGARRDPAPSRTHGLMRPTPLAPILLTPFDGKHPSSVRQCSAGSRLSCPSWVSAAKCRMMSRFGIHSSANLYRPSASPTYNGPKDTTGKGRGAGGGW